MRKSNLEAKFEALKIKEEKKIKQEKSIKTKEAEEARKKQQEKEHRLEESIKKKCRQSKAASGGQTGNTLHRKKQEEGARSSGKDAKRGKKKGKQPQRVMQPEGKHQFEIAGCTDSEGGHHTGNDYGVRSCPENECQSGLGNQAF